MKTIGILYEQRCKVEKRILISKILLFRDKIERWRICINYISNADFVLGYGFDKDKKMWKVYENNERGLKYEEYFKSEEEALEKLYKKVKFCYRTIK